MKTPEQKAEKKARDKAKKAAEFARNNSTLTPAPEFAPAMTAEEFWTTPLKTSEKVIRRRNGR